MPSGLAPTATLTRQLKTILPLIGVLTLVMFFSVYVVPPSSEATVEFKTFSPQGITLIIAIGRTIAFIMGASFSLMVGQLGMRMAVQANIRVASASRRGFNEALSIAYYAGTITGMLTDGLGLLGGTLIFIVFGKAAPDALLGFGFGGTLLALFMRVGGGIYTKAADVGADLVGKVEKDIPEDDPRNAAVIADLVGDNVGDCAGMAADIFESYETTIVSGLILGLILVALTGKLYWIVYPLIIRAIGVISSMLGTFTVPIWEKFPLKFLRAHDAEESMFRSYEVSSVFTVTLSIFLAWLYAHDIRLAALTAVGVGLAVAFNPLTSYFTSTKKAPVKEIVKSTTTGAATTILSGLSVGMESSVWALCVIAISFHPWSFALMVSAGDPNYVLYAIAMIGIGMLSHTGNNVAMDSYGPISDNANGIGEMAWHDMEDEETKKARQIMADLDAVGNTTKAITKGVAIASAVIAAVSLFGSYIADVGVVQKQLGMAGNGCDPRFRYQSVHRHAAGRRVALVVLLAFHPGSQPRGWQDRRRSPPAVQDPRHHGRHQKAGLCRGGWYFHCFRPERTHPAGDHRSVDASCDWPGFAGGSLGWFPGGHHCLRSIAGSIHVQCRRGLGQCQEIH